MTVTPKRETLADRTARKTTGYTVLLTPEQHALVLAYGPTVSQGINAMLRLRVRRPIKRKG